MCSMAEAFTFPEVKRATLDKILESNGFQESGDMFIRSSGEQVHGVVVQRDFGSRTFTINLGFHYTYVPPCSFRSNKLDGIVDFAFRSRLGDIVKGYDHWWPIGNSKGECQETLEEVANLTVDVLNKCERVWLNPDILITQLTPELLEAKQKCALASVDARSKSEVDDARARYLSAFDSSAVRLVYTWASILTHTLLLLICCCSKTKNILMGRKYLEFAESLNIQCEQWNAKLEELRREMH